MTHKRLYKTLNNLHDKLQSPETLSLLERLDEKGSVGLDLSLGDEDCKAAAELVRTFRKIINGPQLQIGDYVQTTQPKTASSDWTAEALASRRWGENGTVSCIHDAHGLTYEVIHDSDGSVGHYEQEELEIY